MFEKNMRIAYLLDFYEDLLDPHIRSVMRAYYDDDLSLAEIAGGEGISRQGVRHLIKKGEDTLEFYESKLALVQVLPCGVIQTANTGRSQKGRPVSFCIQSSFIG